MTSAMADAMARELAAVGRVMVPAEDAEAVMEAFRRLGPWVVTRREYGRPAHVVRLSVSAVPQ